MKVKKYIKYQRLFIEQQGKNRKYFPVFKYGVLGIACAYCWRGRIFLATGSVIGHGVILFCIVGYTGMIIGFLVEVIIYIEEMRNKVSKKLSQ